MPLLPDCPSFREWYYAIHKRDPFPWQQRLADQVHDEQNWPSLVGVPTGLGKTNCLDIAIWMLASQADKHPTIRTAPTRIWWVVNRRLLVDDVFAHAERVADCLAEATEGPLAYMATRLRYIAGYPDANPLEVIKLRGEAETDRPSTPSQPSVICSTIPMFGSRVLFRGYGTSRSLRPIDAALAYTDSLVIIDEAHLAVHLQKMMSGLKSLDTSEVHVLPEGRNSPTVVALTATGDPDGYRFDLNTDDRHHPEITKRINANKPIHLLKFGKATTDSKRINVISSSVKFLLEDTAPGVTLVFVNRPHIARGVAKKLRSRPQFKDNIIVATGQIRGYEAKRITDRILAEARSGHNIIREQHLIIVTTQTLEVGADVDADYLITESCGVRALTQRLGRLNRLGDRPHAKGIYIYTPAQKKTGLWPVYGAEPSAVWEKLQYHSDNVEYQSPPAGQSRGIVHLHPDVISRVLGEADDQPERTPTVASGILWEWIKTSTPPAEEAPVNPYFAGIDDPNKRLRVAWRSHIPTPKNNKKQKLWPRVRGIETVEILVKDAEEVISGLGDDQWCLLNQDAVTVDAHSSGTGLHPGNTIILRSDVGKLDEDGHWDPDVNEHVLDVSILSAGLPVASGVVELLYGNQLPKNVKSASDSLIGSVTQRDKDAISEFANRLLGYLSTQVPSLISADNWEHTINSIRAGLNKRVSLGEYGVVIPYNAVARLPIDASDSERVNISDEHDERSISVTSVGLGQHGEDTAGWATNILRSVGVVSEDLVYVTAEAARLHDVGKSDMRFQRQMRNRHTETDGILLAKSNVPRYQWERNRVKAGWTKGGRHEELSLRIIQEWLLQTHQEPSLGDEQLLQHLIVAHHGYGRPFIVPVEDNTYTPQLTYTINGTHVTVTPDLSVADWAQPERFNELNLRYGPWGLALLESIVRQADHNASRVGTIG